MKSNYPTAAMGPPSPIFEAGNEVNSQSGRPRVMWANMADSDPADETKRKFREALEYKKAHAAGGTNHTDGGGKQSHAHGPAEQRRTFRRKSGG